jgi:two-component system phosphate regulon sensor histidine kinase PhoR
MTVALAEEAQRYRTLYETAPIAFLTTDELGKVIEANAATCELLHVEWRYLLGKPLSVFVDGSSRREFRHCLLAATREQGAEAGVRMRRRGGVAFEAVVRARAAGTELLWTLEDVTEQRLADDRIWGLNRELEDRVKAQTAELEAVMEHMPIGLAVVAPDFRLVRTNPYAREILGDVEQWPVRDGVVHRALQGTGTAAVRRELPGERGPIVVEVSAEPIVGPAGIAGTVITFEDVTERDRRERADRDYVSNAAHQIRTPITAIASALAALEAGAKHDEEARDRFLEHMDVAVQRLTSLAQALLTLSRIERGEAPPAATVVRIRPMLERLSRADASDRVAVDCADDVAALTHEGLEAVGSLLENALEHTDGAVTISGRRADGSTYVEVTDHGPGIPPELRRRAFERFYSGGRGAGLGLSIAAAAVRAAGGGIELADADGVGVVARVTVPTARIVE